MNDTPARIAVIGLGNPIMADDGFGIAALGRLESEWEFDHRVSLVDGGTWGLDLLPTIESADHVLLLDAIRAWQLPGTVLTFEGEEVPRCFSTKLSPHQIDVREILALAELRGRLPGTLVAIGVEPEVVDLRDGLSPIVAEQLDEVVMLAVGVIRAWGASARSTSARPTEELCTR